MSGSGYALAVLFAINLMNFFDRQLLGGVGEGIRYGQPGLQTQITYLAGMTARTDQRIGRDAVERYQVLRKELDALVAEVRKVLGPKPVM